MGYRIYKWVGSQTIWLKSLAPVIRWGAHGQAMNFSNREEAIRASHFIPFIDRPLMFADEGSQSDPIPMQRSQEPR